MLVVADDLTGAADTAGAFAAAGHRAVVRLDDTASGDEAITVVDTDSRALSEVEAFLATAEAVLHQSDRQVFVKIDSTLRGHVRAYVDGAVSALEAPPSRVVVCPAFPARGRTIDGGVVHVDGEPIDAVNLRALFTGFSGAPLFIPTARTDGDLANLVRSMPAGVLWVGSAGLAHHVAASSSPDERSALVRHPARRIAVVSGSQHPVTESQLDALDAGVQVFRIDPRDDALVRQIVPVLEKCDGLVLTGGHTARVVLDALGVDTFEVGGEIEPGVPWAVVDRDDRPIALVTKAGGFGGDDTLRHAIDVLSRSSGPAE